MTQTRNPVTGLTGYPEAIDRLRAEVRNTLDLREDVVVSVTETSCSDPGCHDVETVVAILKEGQRPLIGHVHKPIPEVQPADLLEAFNVASSGSVDE